MRAFRLTGPGSARLVEVETPEPGPGRVRLDVLAAGVCRSDLAVLDRVGALGYGLPFTFGHEICGRVAALGPGVTGVGVGDEVVVHAPVGCGRCRRCGRGETQYCDHGHASGAAGFGLGLDGGMADAVVVGADRLVSSAGLVPAHAAVLADAGLTSYHAVAGSLARLSDADAVAVVIGVGGLGHVALSILRALTGATVVAVDLREQALELARELGADHTATTGTCAEVVRAATDGRGADVVFDFAVAPSTADVTPSLLRKGADLVLVGSGGGVVPVTKPGPLPAGTRVSLPFWGSRAELAEVVGLARRGLLPVRTTEFGLAEAPRVFGRLAAGEVVGRAVLVPGLG
ncbi:alcohol dehydrogenase catalytic domain-containing protein [Amycolatopsis solani]|uniref:alcohol dehydrogenase catalytic domain-containing protein n=1 Tax=Amycolatopsis solani TaxID=3028615 RepID=UPI0025AFABD1|nr:alcohol dehydrogenase catalytic domain-containing protein [Amycolatopsis sp. MEP2-6]